MNQGSDRIRLASLIGLLIAFSGLIYLGFVIVGSADWPLWAQLMVMVSWTALLIAAVIRLSGVQN